MATIDTAKLVRDFAEAFGMDADQMPMIQRIVDDATEEQLVEMAAKVAEDLAAKAALRDRLMADSKLRGVICPATTWMTPHDRFDVARRALQLVEAAAKQAGSTVEVIVDELVSQGDSIQREIELHGEDPRTSQWGKSFYGFRFRLADAINGAKRDETQRAWAAEVARHEAIGEVVCDHCGGAGGAAHWPGFTCYDCGGAKFVRKGHKR